MIVIEYQDPALRMPPRGRIPDASIEAVRTWINSLGKDAAPAPVQTTAKPAEKPPQGRPILEEAAATHKVAPPPEDADDTPSGSDPKDKLRVTPEQERYFETNIRPLLTTKCYTCHTREASGGLRLDSREGVLKGGRDGIVVVPGKPEQSLLIQAVGYQGRIKMPPAGQLSGEELAALRQWIADGAPWPEVEVAAATVSEQDRKFWSFQKPVLPAVPRVDSPWAHNDIDRFILAKLQEKKLKPVGDAAKRTLVRRITYDLTGLPPTPAEVEAFVSDTSPEAYKKLVDRLLSSKAYGEHWGRKWLDLVRYADTSGDDGDFPIPQAIKYRDYVIRAFNEDKPYDRFIREQIAGDLLPSKSEEEHWQNIVATGYLAGAQHMEDRNGYLADVVDNLGYTYLGISLGCARCHNHKFDPIPTANYYSIYGIFKSTQFPNPGSSAVRYQTGFTYRDPKALERGDYKVFAAQLEPVANALAAVLKLPGTYDDLVPQLQVRRMNLFERAPDLGESAYAVKEGVPQDVRVQIYGDEKNLGPEVPRGFITVLGGSALPDGTKGSGRMELAEWLASPDNPLTARVIVNRIWQGHFGRGIVSTPNDFGRRGATPSNQELLDYLALRVIKNGWSIKSLHREILLSHTYQLAATNDAENDKIDPDNAYLWRHSRHQLEAEEVRDSLLADAGLLDTTPSGPYPFPPMYKWNYEQQKLFKPNPTDYENDRRTVYMMVQRTVRPELYILFDGPNTNASTDQRTNSLTPLQALYFLNGKFPSRAAANMAARFATAPTPKQAVADAFLTTYSRPPTDAEMERTLQFLNGITDRQVSQGMDKQEARKFAMEQFVSALFAGNEFMFVD
jgi:hypothetical protein